MLDKIVALKVASKYVNLPLVEISKLQWPQNRTREIKNSEKSTGQMILLLIYKLKLIRFSA